MAPKFVNLRKAKSIQRPWTGRTTPLDDANAAADIVHLDYHIRMADIGNLRPILDGEEGTVEIRMV
ncbi:15205_t:CDS:2 [Rhizophagus irregularis]|nr:15205_t:CDS:2 [Rhizophagus irregularis]